MSTKLIKELADEFDDLWNEPEPEDVEEEPESSTVPEKITVEQISLLIQRHRERVESMDDLWQESEATQNFFALFVRMADAFTRQYEPAHATWASVHSPRKEISVEGRMEMLRIISERMLQAQKKMMREKNPPAGQLSQSAIVINEIARTIVGYPHYFKSFFKMRALEAIAANPGGNRAL